VKEKKIINFEIICYEDASRHTYSNNLIENLKNVKYLNFKKNIGRSSIRNQLGADAKYEWLLFIDCDSKIAGNDFLKKYINAASKRKSKKTVFYGPTIYEKNIVDENTKLHYKYGNLVETKMKKNNFSSHHFLIHKNQFIKNQFDNKITTYGYEDVLFSTFSNLEFKYINNPLFHIGIKTNEVYLSDTEKAITNLANYANEIQINKKVKILKYFKIFEKLNLSKIILIIYNLTENKIIKNLNSTNPKICLFQFYKLGLLIRQIKKLKKSQ
tara:strand:- start:9344 stop:10153 length:810 start_codon:yes stop_codon:yes gene_type:complete